MILIPIVLIGFVVMAFFCRSDQRRTYKCCACRSEFATRDARWRHERICFVD